MPTDDGLKTAENLPVKFFDIVQHVNGSGSNVRDLNLRNAVRPISFVVVSAHRNDRRDSSQSFNHFRSTDIPGVKNELDSFEDAQDLRAQEAMRIGNDTDDWAFHRFLIHFSLLHDTAFGIGQWTFYDAQCSSGTTCYFHSALTSDFLFIKPTFTFTHNSLILAVYSSLGGVIARYVVVSQIQRNYR